MRVHFVAPILALTLAALAPSAASAFVDARQGENIAERWCASCHLVAPDQQRASADVAPFVTLARSKTDEQLAAFLTDPHPKMPDLHLSREEIADLVAYIRSLAPLDAQ